jgi:putative DNA-invertase from lambdoid prophage Rac
LVLLALRKILRYFSAVCLNAPVIAAVAEFERDLLIERTQSGINRAKAAGKRFGRPSSLNSEQRVKVLTALDLGRSIAELAREFKTSRQTIMRIRESALKLPQ